MKNIAAIIDVKNGKVSSRSLQILHFIQALQQIHDTSVNINLFTFDDVALVQVPQMQAVKLYQICGINESGVLSDDQTNQIFTKLSDSSDVCILGTKSNLNDALLSSAAIHYNLVMVPQILSIEVESDKLAIHQSIFSGKALTHLHVNHTSILQINPAFEFSSISVDLIELQAEKINLSASSNFVFTSVDKLSHGGNLTDASFVVGAGRGLKDPSNWGMIETLASKIGAATACSKPVSDINWRPHSEHVGQTGIKIAPQLYIACGISGAIQHIAGVNGSKTIIVINNDPEAPFFKYADYGIVGDVFDIVPEIVKNI